MKLAPFFPPQALFSSSRSPGMESVRMIMVAFVLGQTGGGFAERQCTSTDVFRSAEGIFDYSTAAIPVECTSLFLPKETAQPLGDVGAAALVVALLGNSGITTVWIESNGVGATGCAALALALKVNKALTVVSLRNNPIGDEGAKSIAEALTFNTHLKVLVLGHANIGPEGAVAIGNALVDNTGLEQLHLMGNHLGDLGSSDMFAELTKNTAMTFLVLDDCGITSVGAAAIAQLLERDSPIRTLHLNHNPIEGNGAEALAIALQKTTGLVALVLGDTVAPAMSARIAAALAENSDATQKEAKLKRLFPCHGQTADVLCGGYGELHVTESNECACTGCKVGFSGVFCETTPCSGKDPETFCNSMGTPALQTEDARLTTVCKCADCPPWYSGVHCDVYNPCGSYVGCEASLGSFVLEHFIHLDPAVRDELGVRSAMDLILLRRADDTVTNTDYDINKDDLGVVQHLDRLAATLASHDRKQFIAAIDTAPELDFIPGDPHVTLEAWATSVHLPPNGLQYLIGLGMDDVQDMWDMNDDDVAYLKRGTYAPDRLKMQSMDDFGGFDDEGGIIEDMNPSVRPGASREGAFVDGEGTSFGPGAVKAGLNLIEIKRMVRATNAMQAIKPFDMAEEQNERIRHMSNSRDMSKDRGLYNAPAITRDGSDL
jgi:hypothetical protein